MLWKSEKNYLGWIISTEVRRNELLQNNFHKGNLGGRWKPMTPEQQNLALAVRPASNPFRTEKERKSHKPHYGSPLRRMEELQVPKLFKINRQTHKSNSVTHSVCLLCDQQMACVTKKTTNVTTLPIQQKIGNTYILVCPVFCHHTLLLTLLSLKTLSASHGPHCGKKGTW